MTDKQALRVPECKRHDWNQAVMRDCDFCSQWSLTIHHEDGGCICANCCDAEYASELKSSLESAIERAVSAERRIAELEAQQRRNPVLVYADSYRDMAKQGVESIPVWSVITDLERNIAPLYAAPPAPTVTFYRDGIEAAATWVDQQRESYDSEHGRHDPGTGTFEFGNDAQRDYSATLYEIAEGIRGLHPNTAPPAPVVPDEMTPQQASRSYGGEVRGYRDGWNACRAAMLNGGKS